MSVHSNWRWERIRKAECTLPVVLEGFDAWSLMGCEANPYPVGTTSHEQWQHGNQKAADLYFWEEHHNA